nr:PREDICTED: uncharacterized protein LOC103314143 isoform X1 [Tribolium castaneum]|eukprot:XP_015838477.1 PREDICTED: uncharacterized protein LOC103314143 isoform X1 [Tribolium castaneum]
MKYPLLVSFFLLLLRLISVHCDIGYYWRDFSNSKIPKDAFPAGKDLNGKNTYIGQTLLHTFGFFVMHIIPFSKQNTVGFYSVVKPSPVQKILCSKNHDKFSWYPTSAKTFHLDTTEKHAVIGGYDHVDASRGMLHVGRVMFDGSIKIGSVKGYALQNAELLFSSNNVIKTASSYEVLLFDNSGIANDRKNVTNYCTD